MNTLLLYLMVDIVAIIFCFVSESQKKSINNEQKGKLYKYHFWVVVPIIIMTALVGLRHITVGVDTYGYTQVFYRIIDNTATVIDLNWLGVGYVRFIKIIGTIFGKDYVALNCIIGLISIILLFKSIMENSKNYTMSLFLFISTTLFYQMMNQSRQMLAICIVLYSFKYMKEKKFLKYLICILLAASIHESAIILIPFYFVKDFKLNKFNFLMYLSIILISYFGFSYIEKFIISTYYGSLYYGSDYYASAFTSIIVLIFRICLMSFLFFIASKDSKEKNENKILLNFSIFCTIIQFLTLKVHLLGRISTYFFIFYILSIPNIIESVENKKKRNLYKFIIVLLFIVYHFGYYYLNSKSAGYDYYNFFFQ